MQKSTGSSPAPIQSLVKLQPWFLSLRWKTCLWQNCSLGCCACSEGPALGQNTLMMICSGGMKFFTSYFWKLWVWFVLKNLCNHKKIICSYWNNESKNPYVKLQSSSSSVFCPRAGTSVQMQEHRLQFCRRQVFHCKLRNQGCSFTREWIGPVASHCFPHPTPHSFCSIWTDLKWSEKIPGAPTWRWGEWICLVGPSGLHWNSSQGLNISSIRVFDQIRGPKIPIILCPLLIVEGWNFYRLFMKALTVICSKRIYVIMSARTR